MSLISRRKLIQVSAAGMIGGGWTHGSGSGGQFFPLGVTLQAIDGEVMSGSSEPKTQSNNYYASTNRGHAAFTNAVSAGWDNPSFFPIGAWSPGVGGPYGTGPTGAGAVMAAAGVNFCYNINDDSSLSDLAPNGLKLITAFDSPLIGGIGTETIGVTVPDEPGTTAQWQDPITTTANAIQDNRFWTIQNQWRWINNGDIQGIPAATIMSTLLATPNATTRHLDIQSTDTYWFADAVGTGAFSPENLYEFSGSMTADQIARACHYGDMVDRQRPYQSGNFPAPIGQFIEMGGPYTENTTAQSYITPQQINSAVWASIIHGARIIFYFIQNFGGPQAATYNNFTNAYFQTVQSTLPNWGTIGGGGNETISITGQTTATNALIQSLAPVINSPNAINYVTVSPTASTISDTTSDAGFDLMAKYYNISGGNNKFYIFAMPRYSQATINQTATFTIKDTGTTLVTVINESRTITASSASGGNRTFTDTFANGNTIHIYKIG